MDKDEITDSGPVEPGFQEAIEFKEASVESSKIAFTGTGEVTGEYRIVSIDPSGQVEGVWRWMVGERPDTEGDVYILHWEAVGVVIPWPKGMTVWEAIVAWAKKQEGSNRFTDWPKWPTDEEKK